jgi:hypothetical protein
LVDASLAISHFSLPFRTVIESFFISMTGDIPLRSELFELFKHLTLPYCFMQS